MKIPGNQAGFTLIEALCAMVILSIGILGFFTLNATMITHNFRANNMTVASTEVAGQIERLRQRPYSTLANPPLSLVSPQTGYTVSWTVTPNSPTTDASLIIVTVAVPNNGPTVSYRYVRHDDGT